MIKNVLCHGPGRKLELGEPNLSRPRSRQAANVGFEPRAHDRARTPSCQETEGSLGPPANRGSPWGRKIRFGKHRRARGARLGPGAARRGRRTPPAGSCRAGARPGANLQTRGCGAIGQWAPAARRGETRPVIGGGSRPGSSSARGGGSGCERAA